jgi:hypothetical protein
MTTAATHYQITIFYLAKSLNSGLLNHFCWLVAELSDLFIRELLFMSSRGDNLNREPPHFAFVLSFTNEEWTLCSYVKKEQLSLTETFEKQKINFKASSSSRENGSTNRLGIVLLVFTRKSQQVQKKWSSLFRKIKSEKIHQRTLVVRGRSIVVSPPAGSSWHLQWHVNILLHALPPSVRKVITQSYYLNSAACPAT